MTVATDTSRSEHNGNGSTTVFAYSFRILDEDHIAVYVDDVLQTITTDYTVSGVGDAGGGNITFLVAPDSGTLNVVFLRDVPVTQETDYVENDPFPAATHEDALDKLTMIIQQLNEVSDRTITLAISTPSTVSASLPAPAANEFFRWNSGATALESVTLTESGVAQGDVTYENLNANGDVGFGATQVPQGSLTMPLTQIGVTAGKVTQVDQAVTATTRDATTTLGTTLSHTLSDTDTDITAFNGVAGVTYRCRALGTGLITHHATNLIVTQTGASIETAAGDTFDVYMLTATTCRILNYTRSVGFTKLVQQVNATPYTTYSPVTSVIPGDDTIPQITEGDQLNSVTITPKSAASSIEIEAEIPVMTMSTNQQVIIALFETGVSNALAVATKYCSANESNSISVKTEIAATDTDARTYTLRAGVKTAGTVRINGDASTRLFGGISAVTMSAKEILA